MRPPGQMASASAAPTMGRHARDLSTIELVKEITAEVGLLAQKQIELAKTELKADLRAEAATVGGLGVAALAALAAVNLLLVTLVLALAQTMRPWLAGLLVSAFMLVVAGIVALVSWNKRVRSPLERTRRTVKEDVQFTKERMV
ncbi:MAG: phage holin family protein [Polyangia bacterium]